jgi:glyoxalase family protein
MIPGIHHITAVASDPQRNLDYYTGTLGLRLVKQTVNFDDPGTYHLYFGDEAGTPGTVLTFFPWPGAKRGRAGAGQVIATAFAVPEGSLGWWHARLAAAGHPISEEGTRLGERFIATSDPDGMRIELVERAWATELRAWTTPEIDASRAIRGFDGATLGVRNPESTGALLAEVFGMRRALADDHRTRYEAADSEGRIGRIIDIVRVREMGTHGAGIVHHIAVRARNDGEQAAWRARLAEAGYQATPVIDRNYFHSVYFREHNGVLFEIATDAPGFAIDESPATLGTGLKLPAQYENRRAEIERHLPPLTLAGRKDAPAYSARMETGDRGGILALHGTGGDEHSLVDLARKLDPRATIISPRGNVSEHGNLRFFRRIREGVFDLQDVERRSDQLGGWAAEQAKARGLSPAGMIALGYSNGANIAAAMLLRGIRVFDHAVLLRSMVTIQPETLPDLRGVHVLMINGRADPIIPIANARGLASLLTRAGATVELLEIDGGHELARQDLERGASWIAERRSAVA